MHRAGRPVRTPQPMTQAEPSALQAHPTGVVDVLLGSEGAEEIPMWFWGVVTAALAAVGGLVLI